MLKLAKKTFEVGSLAAFCTNMQNKSNILAFDVGLDGRKCRWVVEQDFHRNFRVNVTWFFAFSLGLLD